MSERSEQAQFRPVVVLVGPMGSGKSTVGALLADRLGVAARDTDLDVEAAEGLSVQEIFVDRGEPAFRALEAAAVARALSSHDGVLSLGGGAVLDPHTRELLAGHTVVFLNVSMPEAIKRIGLGQTRPLLNQAVGGMRARIKALLDERTPIYAAVATHVVDTDDKSPSEVVAEIEEMIQ